MTMLGHTLSFDKDKRKLAKTFRTNLIKVKFGKLKDKYEPYKIVKEEFSDHYHITDNKGIVLQHIWLTEDQVLRAIKKNKHDIKKAIDSLIEEHEEKRKELLIQRETDKVKARKERRVFREEAERRIYGKAKPDKRESLTEDEKDAIFNKFNNECAVCKVKEGLHIHHKDNNPSNNRSDNLVVLCGVCHKKIHMRVR